MPSEAAQEREGLRRRMGGRGEVNLAVEMRDKSGMYFVRAVMR